MRLLRFFITDIKLNTLIQQSRALKVNAARCKVVAYFELRFCNLTITFTYVFTWLFLISQFTNSFNLEILLFSCLCWLGQLCPRFWCAPCVLSAIALNRCYAAINVWCIKYFINNSSSRALITELSLQKCYFFVFYGQHSFKFLFI